MGYRTKTFILALWIVAFVWPNELSMARKPDRPDRPTGISSGTFSFDELRELITKRRVSSVEELIPLLPQNLRDNHLLAYSSGSQHSNGISPETPRVMLFDEEARFVLAFPSNPKGANAQSVEFFQFEDPPGEFDFGEIRFEEKKRRLPLFKKKRAPVYHRKPGSCLKCHGSKGSSRFRPNWEAYPVWKGFYGSKHASMDSEANAREAQLLSQLEDSYESNPRLASVLNEDSFDPKLMGQRNSRFSRRIASNNLRSMARRLLNHPLYPQYRNAILLAARSSVLNISFPEEQPAPDKIARYWKEVSKHLPENSKSRITAEFEALYPQKLAKLNRHSLQRIRGRRSAMGLDPDEARGPHDFEKVGKQHFDDFRSKSHEAVRSGALDAILRDLGIQTSDYAMTRNRIASTFESGVGSFDLMVDEMYEILRDEADLGRLPANVCTASAIRSTRTMSRSY